LGISSSNGHIDVVKYLIENGAYINLQNKKGKTALAMAEEKKHKDIVEYLKNGEKMEKKNVKEFTDAVYKGDFEKVKEFVKNGVDVNSKDPQQLGSTALHLASQYGHLEIVEYLVDNGADTSEMTIVDYVNCGWLPKVKEAIESGTNPNQRVQRPYDDGRGTIEEANTLLINAVEYGHLEIVKYLLKRGADVNLKGFSFNDGSQTALYQARERNHTEIIKLLQDAGAQK